MSPKPMLSRRITTTLGAPFGAFTSNRGGAFALCASSSVIGGYSGAGTGSTVRFMEEAGRGPLLWTSDLSCHEFFPPIDGSLPGLYVMVAFLRPLCTRSQGPTGAGPTFRRLNP